MYTEPENRYLRRRSTSELRGNFETSKGTGMTAQYQVQDGVAFISLENPPVNGFGYHTRVCIADGIVRALDDSGVKAIVLAGAGNAFSGGADMREFGTPKALQEPSLQTIIDVIETSPKPVLPAVHSVAMGGGQGAAGLFEAL
jgi:3-hydroxyacyl-CoA dehydrogenase